VQLIEKDISAQIYYTVVVGIQNNYSNKKKLKTKTPTCWISNQRPKYFSIPTTVLRFTHKKYFKDQNLLNKIIGARKQNLVKTPKIYLTKNIL
jgi:hypothetical protein